MRTRYGALSPTTRASKPRSFRFDASDVASVRAVYAATWTLNSVRACSPAGCAAGARRSHGVRRGRRGNPLALRDVVVELVPELDIVCGDERNARRSASRSRRCSPAPRSPAVRSTGSRARRVCPADNREAACRIVVARRRRLPRANSSWASAEQRVGSALRERVLHRDAQVVPLRIRGAASPSRRASRTRRRVAATRGEVPQPASRRGRERSSDHRRPPAARRSASALSLRPASGPVEASAASADQEQQRVRIVHSCSLLPAVQKRKHERHQQLLVGGDARFLRRRVRREQVVQRALELRAGSSAASRAASMRPRHPICVPGTPFPPSAAHRSRSRRRPAERRGPAPPWPTRSPTSAWPAP